MPTLPIIGVQHAGSAQGGAGNEHALLPAARFDPGSTGRRVNGLQRFVDAQAPVFDAVLRELSQGDKRSHWMWFVFPQLKALGRSATARHYGLESLDEARAYAGHALLGSRLRQCTQCVLDVQGRSALRIFGMPDTLKFCSSMTLFERAAPHEPRFAQALDKYYAGRRDELTLALLPPSPLSAKESP